MNKQMLKEILTKQFMQAYNDGFNNALKILKLFLELQRDTNQEITYDKVFKEINQIKKENDKP